MVQGRARAFSVAAAFAGLLLIGLPSSSLAAHDLRIYKMEKQVVLDSDEDTNVNLPCLGTDRVLDGMWRIDHADLDEDQPAFGETIGTAVDVREAYSDTASRYHFSFVKNAIYRVQLKVFVTCMGAKSENGGKTSHAHELTYVPASGAPNSEATTIPAGSTGLKTVTKTCAASPKSIIVAPGFKITPDADVDVDPDDLTNPPIGLGRIYRSILADTTSSSLANSWTWAFSLGNTSSPNGGGKIEVSWRCLNIRVDKLPGGASAPDRHKLVKRVRSATPSVGANAFANPTLSCGDAYKAVVAGFDILDARVDGTLAPFSSGLWKTWYLGMDPRPKSRAYRFMSTSTADTVTIAATCLNYRTT